MAFTSQPALGTRKPSPPLLAAPVQVRLSRADVTEVSAEPGIAENGRTTGADMECKVPYSRAFNDKSTSGQSRPGSTVDTRHVHIYLRRQGSRTSVYSTASAGLATSDNTSSFDSSSSHSRPVSAESKLCVQKSSQPNTRIVIPNSGNRLFNPSAPANPVLPRSSSIPTLRRRSSYLDKLVWQILDYVYMGGVEAAYNENLLCRLNIEYLIDISNVEPMKVPRSKRSDCPCLCSLETAHSRARMAIMIDETSQIDLVPYFDDVNQFIDSARACGKNVLIHSYTGKYRCVVLVLQYLMKCMDFNLDAAMEYLKGKKGDVVIRDNFQKSLRKWESMLQQKPRTVVVPKIGGPKSGLQQNANTGQMGERNMKRAAWM